MEEIILKEIQNYPRMSQVEVYDFIFKTKDGKEIKINTGHNHEITKINTSISYKTRLRIEYVMYYKDFENIVLNPKDKSSICLTCIGERLMQDENGVEYIMETNFGEVKLESFSFNSQNNKYYVDFECLDNIEDKVYQRYLRK